MEENSETIDIVHTYTTQQEAEADARNDRFGFKGMHTHTHTLTPTHILDMSYSDRFFRFRTCWNIFVRGFPGGDNQDAFHCRKDQGPSVGARCVSCLPQVFNCLQCREIGRSSHMIDSIPATTVAAFQFPSECDLQSARYVCTTYFFPTASAKSSKPHLLAKPGRSATVGLRPRDMSQLSSLNSSIKPSLWLGLMLLMEP